MMVIGLLTSEEEVNELQYIAKVCTLEQRIHRICHIARIKNISTNY